MLFSPTGHLRIKKQIKIINKELRKRGYKVVVTTNKLSVIKDRYWEADKLLFLFTV